MKCAPIDRRISLAVCILFTNFEHAHAQDGIVYSYVAFDKVGSTMMRYVLSEREARLTRRRLKGYSIICNPLFYSHQCRAVHDTAVVNLWGMNGFNYCETVVPHRPCKYFTLLRHPIARLASAYSYFCQGCAEHGRQCSGQRKAGSAPRRASSVDIGAGNSSLKLTCPHMTIEQYAEYFGNVYTRAFAPHWHWHQAPADATKAAEMFLRSIFVMTEQDLAQDLPFARLGTWLNDSALAQHKSVISHHRSHSSTTPAALETILADDIRLYNSIAVHHDAKLV